MRLLVLAVVGCGTSAPLTPPDAALPDPCADCPTDHICVLREQNVCGIQDVACVVPDPSCPSLSCTTACHDAYCGDNVYSCSGAGCAGKLPSSPRAFECNGI